MLKDFKSFYVRVQKAKARWKGREELHVVALKLCSVERQQEDVMVAAKTSEAKRNTREFFSL